MQDEVIFPHISGLNWPSTLLHALLRLRELGVTAERIRLTPRMGHFAAPEVTYEDPRDDPDPDAPGFSLKHPRPPMVDPRTRRLTVERVDPLRIRPRLSVNVRSENVMQYFLDDAGVTAGVRDETVGRLAHFLEPMLAAVADGAEAPLDPREIPVERLAREIGELYPELLRTLTEERQDLLARVATALEEGLNSDDRERRAVKAGEIADACSRSSDPGGLRDAFLEMAAKVTQSADGVPPPGAGWLRGWADYLGQADPAARREGILSRLLTEPPDRAAILPRLRDLRLAVEFETPANRRRLIREMVEVMTTISFQSAAVIDRLFGLSWIHGRISEFRLNGPAPHNDGLLLSMAGGLDHRSVLTLLLEEWAESGDALGVAGFDARQATERDGGGLDLSSFTAGEARELWALAAWRRDTASPTALLEIALRRFVHPEASLETNRFVGTAARFGSIFSQPQQAGGFGGTAVLGGTGLLQYPGAVIYIPLEEDSDTEAVTAKRRLEVALRLFLPVCYRVEVIWQVPVARLDRPTHLHHDFQDGPRLAEVWLLPEESLEERAHDPHVL